MSLLISGSIKNSDDRRSVDTSLKYSTKSVKFNHHATKDQKQAANYRRKYIKQKTVTASLAREINALNEEVKRLRQEIDRHHREEVDSSDEEEAVTEPTSPTLLPPLVIHKPSSEEARTNAAYEPSSDGTSCNAGDERSDVLNSMKKTSSEPQLSGSPLSNSRRRPSVHGVELSNEQMAALNVGNNADLTKSYEHTKTVSSTDVAGITGTSLVVSDARVDSRKLAAATVTPTVEPVEGPDQNTGCETGADEPASAAADGDGKDGGGAVVTTPRH